MIRGFFDTIGHGWLVKFVENRVADRRVVRLIQKGLNAGVLDGARTRSEKGTPQGGSASPRLANIYLRYVFYLWVQQWRQRHAQSDMIFVRYADDFIVGFQHKSDAERFLADLRRRWRDRIPIVGQWLRSVVGGHIRYYGAPKKFCEWWVTAKAAFRKTRPQRRTIPARATSMFEPHAKIHASLRPSRAACRPRRRG